MKKTQRNSFFILVSLLLLVLTLSSCDEMLRKEEEFAFDINPESLNSTLLDIDSRNGYIEVSPWERDYFRIEGKKYIQGTGNLEDELGKVQIKYKEIGSTTRIYVDFPESSNIFKMGSYGANLNISVPLKVLNTVNRIDLDTSNGSIALKECNGSVIADTSNGRVIIENCTGDFKLKSSNGSITINQLKGQIDADTSNGSIKIEDCFLSGFNNAFNTSNGSITGNFTPSLSGNMTFDTSNGRIDLKIPQNSNLNFSAKTSNASVSIENLKMRMSQDSKKRKEGTINEGGASINLSSSNGSVKLIGE